MIASWGALSSPGRSDHQSGPRGLASSREPRWRAMTATNASRISGLWLAQTDPAPLVSQIVRAREELADRRVTCFPIVPDAASGSDELSDIRCDGSLSTNSTYRARLIAGQGDGDAGAPAARATPRKRKCVR